MLYLQQSLMHIANLHPTFTLKDFQKTLSLELREWDSIRSFNLHLKLFEQRYIDAQEKHQERIHEFRCVPREDEDDFITAYWNLGAAQARAYSYRRTLKELAMSFALHHYLRVEGFELDPDVYEYTVDSQNVSVE